MGTPSRFIDIANDVNQQMPRFVVDRILRGLNERGKPTKGARVLVLGLAYKSNSSDARETPATLVVRGLRGLGAEVLTHDPHVRSYELDGEITRVEVLDAELLATTDAVVILTAHDDVDHDLVAAHAPYVFDARRCVATGPNVEFL